MNRFKRALVLAAMTGLVTVGQAAPPPEETVRQVYTELLAQADADKDGTLSVAECTTIFKDPTTAKKNCRFFDVDKNGAITQEEYVEQVGRVTSRKH